MSANSNTPALPRKYIVEKPHLVDQFRNSASYAKIIAYIQACAEAVERTPRSRRLTANIDVCPPTVRFFVEVFFPHLHDLVDKIPLEELKLQRFGNKAFRTFHAMFEADVVELMRQLVATFTVARDEAAAQSLAVEIAEYMKDAFGNGTRIDYGTGHELHFFIVLMICLEECGDTGGTLKDVPNIIIPFSTVPPAPVPIEKRDDVRLLRQGMVFEVFGLYIAFMRRLQQHYSLEPAGSHGVWGLDDYHHMPFIFGAAQLIGMEEPTEAQSVDVRGGAGHNVILPKHICEESEVRRHAAEFFYFAQIAWIRDNKSGPFFEHSSMLYNISAVEHWEKIYTGMVKMYAAEVLAKFPVVQHLLFGPHLPWPNS